MVRLKAPENCGGFSYEGTSIELVDGHIEVEATEIVKVAMEHGFVVATAAETKASKKADK